MRDASRRSRRSSRIASRTGFSLSQRKVGQALACLIVWQAEAYPTYTLTHWWVFALCKTASQTFCVSRASRKVGWAGCFLA